VAGGCHDFKHEDFCGTSGVAPGGGDLQDADLLAGGGSGKPDGLNFAILENDGNAGRGLIFAIYSVDSWHKGIYFFHKLC